MIERIVLRREELLSTAVDAALRRERQLRARTPAEAPPVSPLRRVMQSGLFYLPLSGALAAVLAWGVIEPGFSDLSTVGGEVVLRNEHPFDIQMANAVLLTVGSAEVVVLRDQTRMEPGADGQAPFGSLDEVGTGTRVEATGMPVGTDRVLALGLRPATAERARRTGDDVEPEATVAAFLLFPLTAVAVALALLLAEGISSRNWVRMLERSLLGALLTAVFAVLAYLPAGLFMLLADASWNPPDDAIENVASMSPWSFVVFAACRSAAWACIGAAAGVGMNLVRSTRVQLRNSVVGGALGGALGGLFFDPIDRFFKPDSFFAGSDASRLVGLTAVGLCVGLFVALVDHLARQAWLRVKTGPLAGKSLVLYKTPTTLGSSPACEIYLFKDAAIAPRHAAIHRVGNRYEIEDLGGPSGTLVGGRRVRRHRLASGEAIVLGATVLEFEERAKRSLPGERGIGIPRRSPT